MACFLVSGAEAVAVTVVKKVEDKKENKGRYKQLSYSIIKKDRMAY